MTETLAHQAVVGTPATHSQTGSTMVSQQILPKARIRTFQTQTLQTMKSAKDLVSMWKLLGKMVGMNCTGLNAATVTSMSIIRLAAGRKLVNHSQKANLSRGSVNPTGTVVQ